MDCQGRKLYGEPLEGIKVFTCFGISLDENLSYRVHAGKKMVSNCEKIINIMWFCSSCSWGCRWEFNAYDVQSYHQSSL